jgi:hypothetical protein
MASFPQASPPTPCAHLYWINALNLQCKSMWPKNSSHPTKPTLDMISPRISKILTWVLNKTSTVCRMQHGTFVQPLLPWKSSIIYSECAFVALVIQHAKYMLHIILSPVACPAVPFFFFFFFHKRHNFPKKVTKHCVCSLQLLSQTFLNVQTESDITNFHRYPGKAPRHSHQILIKLEFSSFSKNTQI